MSLFPITPALLATMAGRAVSRAITLAPAMTTQLPAYEISTPLRVAHFLAQATHETEEFRFLEEIWGPTPAQMKYEGRADLGNTQPGDGYRFRGRGVFQITGRANYARYGQLLNLDLVGDPDLAADPANAVLIACAYWKGHGIDACADADNLDAVTRKINGGTNGIVDRGILLARAKRALGLLPGPA